MLMLHHKTGQTRRQHGVQHIVRPKQTKITTKLKAHKIIVNARFVVC